MEEMKKEDEEEHVEEEDEEEYDEDIEDDGIDADVLNFLEYDYKGLGVSQR